MYKSTILAIIARENEPAEAGNASNNLMRWHHRSVREYTYDIKQKVLTHIAPRNTNRIAYYLCIFSKGQIEIAIDIKVQHDIGNCVKYNEIPPESMH